jgi:hypothetical protein
MPIVLASLSRAPSRTLEAEHLERLAQADLGDLGHIQRTAEGAGDVIQTMKLGLPGAMPGFRVVEIAADEARVEVLDHIAEAALRQEQDLVGVLAAAQLVGHPGDHRPAEHRQSLHQGFERDALLGVAPGCLPGHRVVLVPGHLGVRPQRAEEDL